MEKLIRCRIMEIHFALDEIIEVRILAPELSRDCMSHVMVVKLLVILIAIAFGIAYKLGSDLWL